MSRFKPLLLCAGLLSSLWNFAGAGPAFAEAPSADIRSGVQAPPPPDQRVALVIGNSNYQTAPKLANPGNDAQSVAQLLNSAGFEVTQATDLTRTDMVRAVQDFSSRVAARGPGAVAMIYYAGHGVQLAGENYLLPVDARISAPSDLDDNSLRLVDVMGTLESIPSRMRIVILDACRNNPFPEINDAGRGLAIVDAPRGSIVGYSTAPGMEAQDGDGSHSPYTSAFLNAARVPNLPIEQLFKRVRLEVNYRTEGRQTPWESSSLTSDFYFFGDTAVAATRAPDRSPIVQTASNLPSRSVRQAYDYVLSEGQPEYYQEFIRIYPHDPLSDRIRVLLGNLLQAAAWHKAVVVNSPVAYKAFYDNHANSPYAQVALKLQAQPKAVPLMQFTHLAKVSPTFKPGNTGISPNLGISKDNLGAQGGHMTVPSKIVTLPGKGMTPINPANGGNNPGNTGIGNTGNNNSGNNNGNTGPITTLPGKINPTPINTGNGGANGNGSTNNGNAGPITTLPGKVNPTPINTGNGGTNGNGSANGGNAGPITTLPGKINPTPINTGNGNANGNTNGGTVTTLPGKVIPSPVNTGNNTGNTGTPGKITTLPGRITPSPVITGNGNGNGNAGKVKNLPGRINANPVQVQSKPAVTMTPRNLGGGNSSSRLVTTQSGSSFGGSSSMFKR